LLVIKSFGDVVCDLVGEAIESDFAAIGHEVEAMDCPAVALEVGGHFAKDGVGVVDAVEEEDGIVRGLHGESLKATLALA
jgi:hypothetical protein